MLQLFQKYIYKIVKFHQNIILSLRLKRYQILFINYHSVPYSLNLPLNNSFKNHSATTMLIPAFSSILPCANTAITTINA